MRWLLPLLLSACQPPVDPPVDAEVDLDVGGPDGPIETDARPGDAAAPPDRPPPDARLDLESRDAAADLGPDLGPDAAPPPPDAGLDGLALLEVGPVVLAVWDSGRRAFFAGGEAGPAGGLLAYTDGDVLRRADVPPGPALWWVWGADDERVWACGAGGRIVALRDGVWVEEPTGLPATAVLWGLWGSGPRNLWAVGGSPRPDGPKGVVLRSQGDGVWYRVEDGAIPTDVNLFKVWGPSRDEVHLVGERGVAVVYERGGFSRVHSGLADQLTTVHGRPEGPVYAVGGLRSGVALRWSGAAWIDESPPDAPALSGVYVRPGGVAVAVGQGAVFTRTGDDPWVSVPLDERAIPHGFHAVYAEGAPWIVGGRLELGRGGVVLSRSPALREELGPPPPLPDAGVPDAAPVLDARPVDAARDVQPTDAAPPPPDAAAPDAAPPEMGIEGFADDCFDEPCTPPLSCWGFAGEGLPFRCSFICQDASECPGLEDPCCGIPGPNVLVRLCGERAWFRPADCAGQ